MGFYDDLPYRIEDMQFHDIDEVMAIEYRSFSNPWTVRAYKYEVATNRFSHFIVIREALDQPPQTRTHSVLGKFLLAKPRIRRPVLGYGGFWLLLDEAHISTIAVAPDWRGMGLGELLLVGLLDRAIRIGADYATLEVRVSNEVAQNLYRKYQFQTVGVRSRYYSDNQEDALVMTTPRLRNPAFLQGLLENKQALVARLKKRLRRAPGEAQTQMG